jgi:copper chaperone NosL
MVLGIPAMILLFGGRAATGPEPIRFGRDACHRCHMLIAAGGFAAERRGNDGALHKYDDVGCLLLGIQAAHEETTQAWVEDHEGSGFVPLMEATLVQTDAVATPMGYGIVAFREPTAASRFIAERGGRMTPLEELMRSGPRLSRLTGNPHSPEDNR